MPEVRGEAIRIEGGITTGGKVIFDDPNLFTELPKVSLTPVTNKIALVSLIKRTLTELEYKVSTLKGKKWKDETNKISIIWLAIQEK